jgi:hypothetical protein
MDLKHPNPEQEITKLKLEVDGLRKKNKEMSQYIKTVFNNDHFSRLRDSIGICLNKLVSDIDDQNSNVIYDGVKSKTSPMEVLETIEKHLFDFCGLAEQNLNSLKMQLVKSNLECTYKT